RHEPGYVLREHDTFAENALAHPARRIDRLTTRLRRRYDLEQMEIPWRIEEVHAEEVRAERRRPAFGQHPHRNARRVRRDDDVPAKHGLEPRVEVPLRRGLFYDGLDDQITLSQQPEVVRGIADVNQRRTIYVHKSRGTRLLRPVETLPNDRVLVGLRPRHVQQHHWQSRPRRQGR